MEPALGDGLTALKLDNNKLDSVRMRMRKLGTHAHTRAQGRYASTGFVSLAV